MDEVIQKAGTRELNRDEILLVILAAVSAFVFAIGVLTLATLFTPEERISFVSIEYYAFQYWMQAVFGAFLLGMSYFIGFVALCGWIQYLSKPK